MVALINCRTFNDALASAIWVGKETVEMGKKTLRGVVTITANMCKDVGNLRALAGMIGAFVEALDLNHYSVKAFGVLPQSCKSFNKAMGGIHVAVRANEFANGSAFASGARLISRVAFIARDVLSCLEFLESQAIIAAGTASKTAFTVFRTSAQSIIPTLDLIGWSADSSLHLHDLIRNVQNSRRDGLPWYKGLTWESGFHLTMDATKLVAISLTGKTRYALQMIRLGAIIGSGAVVFARAVKNYVDTPRG